MKEKVDQPIEKPLDDVLNLDQPSPSPVKHLAPHIRAKKIVDKLGVDDALIVACMLDGATEKPIYKLYKFIRKNYPKEDWLSISRAIDEIDEKTRNRNKKKAKNKT